MSDNFRIRTVDALSDDSLQNNFRGAMDFLQDKRHQAFQDLEFEKLRSEGADIRKNVIAHLPDLLEKLERKCIDNGIHVHWAEDAQQACRIIERIAQDNEVKQVVKGKSMVSEEIELNQHLEAQGIECIETDMGEYIVQLDHEKSSHIIMPAIHKTKEQIAQLFADKLNEDFGKPPKDATVDELIGVGRKVLRQKFMQADMGISGVNFAIAETGTLCLVANEGNGRISTGVPDIHVALMGLEKVIPSFAELPTLLKLLTRSATGQIMTTYLNMISSPRKDQELDGPSQFHLVIIDNKRSAMYQDDVLQETLTCIRCGACMNHCPVYTRIGGHAYGSTYPGPIGQIVTPQIEGIEHAGDLLDACSLNGACGEACPVSIDLPVLIRELRNKQTSLKPPHRVIWNIWRQFYRSTKRHALLSKFVSLCSRLPMPTPKAWSNTRTFPKPAPESFSTLIKNKKRMSVNQSKANFLNRLRVSQQMIESTESETEKKSAINNASGKEVLTRLLENNRAILIETDYKELAQNINTQIKQLQPVQYIVSEHPRLKELLGNELTESNQCKLADTWREAKQQLFEDIELSICFADSALCEQGALLLKADKNQPRNLSLIPETSFIVVEASNIFPDLQQCVQSAHFDTRNLPSNMVLISGPSKTADIQ